MARRVTEQDLHLHEETECHEPHLSVANLKLPSSATCSTKKGYCLIINNLDVDCEQIQLQALIRKNFEFIVTEWSRMNSRKLNEKLKFLKGQLHSDQCLLIVFLSNWKNNTDGKKSISFRGFQEVISESAESMEFTVLVVSDMHGLPQDVPLATMDVSNPTCKLHQCIIKNGNADDVYHNSCHLMEFLAIRDDEQVAALSLETDEPAIQLQKELGEFIRQSIHEDNGGSYAHPEEYTEYSMVFKFWENIRTTIIDNVEHQKDKIKKLSSDLRKRKLACALNNLITDVLTVATFMFLLFNNRDQEYTNYQEILLLLFGVALQLLSMAGNIYTIYIFIKKYKAIKLERNIAGELAEIDQRHWAIVDDARKNFENNENTAELTLFLKDISPNAIDTLKSVFNLSALTAYFARLVATTFLRTVNIGLRITLVLAIVASAIFIPIDLAEIGYRMWLIVWQRKYKNVENFDKYAECLKEDLNKAKAKIENCEQKLIKTVKRQISRKISSTHCSSTKLTSDDADASQTAFPYEISVDASDMAAQP